jgi:16S rRNA (guanine966-N2)-methyltransferase
MRGGLFSALGNIEELGVLDVFAGSGAIAIEAISRGAVSAIAIEPDKSAYRVIIENINSLGLETKIKATKALFYAWSQRNPDMKFDLVLADPPYQNIPTKDIQRLPEHLQDKGTLVLSWPGKLEPLEFNGLSFVKNKNYGDSQLVFYKKIS